MSLSGLAVPDLDLRHRQAELMDDPSLDRSQHVEALQALRRVNRVSLSARRVWSDVARIHRDTGDPVRVLDLACGGGDVLVRVARRARRARVPAELHGIDVSPVAISEARRAGATEAGVDFTERDALEGDLPDGYDLITTSLFLHHLDRPVAVRLLRRMASATRHSILIQDLRRTRLGYLFAWIGLHSMTGSDVARSDGLVSVRASFTLAEVSALCRDAGIADARVERGWPQRFTIRWRNP